ncbi:probable LRR receptor-like serine/threonine-protein kinase IRK [Oryza glaberrima]|uniref:Protein kinase domain-containing protein n=1 Tax=Oryza glaberrima TaxID=4538 RepID=I1PB26_ORYGL|nr:probable LRR receptor-like serine/threonine-protein kinase IRK [Oryza glaberrima]
MRALVVLVGLACLAFVAEAKGGGAASAAALDDDVLGLIVFKADVVDPEGRLATWSEDDERPCAWAGVTCDPLTGRVAGLSLAGYGLSGKLGRGLLRLESLQSLSLSGNNFSGDLPADLARLPDLQSLDLSANAFSGAIPDGFFGHCRNLRDVSLANNAFSGDVPRDVGACATLASLNLSSNRLAGALPSDIWSLNALRTLDLSGNAITGDLPVGVSRMFNLRSLNLRSNRLAGSLPDDIGDCPLLRSVDLGSNNISGNLPESLRRLSTCTYLDLSSNALTGNVPTWVGEMASLETLDLSGNKFSGEIPGSIGGLMSLKELRLSGNGFTGGLPESIGGCKSLVHVDVSWNSLTGTLPSWVFASGVQWVSVSDNTLSGEVFVPVNASSMVRGVDLSSNAFSGRIPSEISQVITLQSLNMSWNSLSGSIPPSIVQMKSLEVLDLTANRLNGSIPATVGGESLRELRLAKNSLTGEIPAQIGNLSALASLDLSHNNLTGAIPATIANITNLQTVDLSRNKLTGGLPKQLSDLPHLIRFNISHNQLSGDLPPGSFFDTIPLSSVSDNPGLCGAKLNSSCPGVLPKPIVLNPDSSSDPLSQPEPTPNGLRHKKTILSISALVAIGAAVLITVGVITITVLNLRVRTPGSHSAAELELSDGYLSQSPTTDVNSGKLVMFGGGNPEFSASTHALLNKDCELGRGGFGTVYKTTLRDGQPVAIKKLTVSSLVKSQDEFEREVKMLGKLRHRNLVALKGYYWTPSLQLLIYEFVSGGNLHKQLHESSTANCLSWKERFDIVLGIARSLAHLHRHDIIHYNLKSSNILLDGSGDAKVGDYGLAKLLPMLDRYVLSSKVQSALGYMAPEFACRTVKITEKCDVYGFGVLVLEILTGRTPVQYMEDDVIVLCDVVRAALDEGKVEECVDERLCGKFPLEEAVPIMKLGLVCTSQVPSNRPDMSEVVNILELIRCPQDSPETELG